MNRLRFYAKLAVSNIKNNRKFYIPYILTGMGTSLMLYIMTFLLKNEGLNGSFGGRTLAVFLQFGFYIILIFAVVVLFYTNGFLMKRRKNELGLFIILGMEKRHLGGVQFFESFIVALTSIIGGVALGVGFSGLTLSLITRMAHVNTPLIFSVNIEAVILTLGVFIAIYFLIFLYNLTVVGRARPIELLKGSSVGEKEPKARWLLTITGILALGGGYAIAVLVKDPMSAVLLFFVAVVLVIIGTYLLFTTGSVTILKSLRNNKKYYYKTNHFINVSGMIYRMKQNAVGLANICILSTMVLVMVSTTVALNAGVEDILDKQFSGDAVIGFDAPAIDLLDDNLAAVQEFADANGVSLENLDYDRALGFNGLLEGSEFAVSSVSSNDLNMAAATVMPSDEYARKTGRAVSLTDGEMLSYAKGVSLPENMTLLGLSLTNTGEAEDFPIENELEGYLSSFVRLVVSPGDFERLTAALHSSADAYYDDVLEIYMNTPELSDEETMDFTSSLYSYLMGTVGEPQTDADGNVSNSAYNYSYFRCRASEAENIYSMYGGFLFLGISLGIMFMMATILIIYYKQITEGYNDKERFVIMRKVGLARDEIKKSIHSQILTVFFLPLLAAVLHVAFAFSIIKKLLAVLYLTDVLLYAICTVATIAVFALFYLAIYALTAREYYKIISKQ